MPQNINLFIAMCSFCRVGNSRDSLRARPASWPGPRARARACAAPGPGFRAGRLAWPRDFRVFPRNFSRNGNMSASSKSLRERAQKISPQAGRALRTWRSVAWLDSKICVLVVESVSAAGSCLSMPPCARPWQGQGSFSFFKTRSFQISV